MLSLKILRLFEAKDLPPRLNFEQPILSKYWDDEEADERGRREAKQRNRLNQCLLPSKESTLLCAYYAFKSAALPYCALKRVLCFNSASLCPRKSARPNITVWLRQTLQSSSNMCQLCHIVELFSFYPTVQSTDFWETRLFWAGDKRSFTNNNSKSTRMNACKEWNLCKVWLLPWLYCAVRTICVSYRSLKYLWKPRVRYLLRYRDLWVPLAIGCALCGVERLVQENTSAT